MTTPQRPPRGWASGVGAAPAPGAQGDAQPWLPCTVVLIEVQPEAQEAQALIGAGRQQHQELLHHALRRQRGALAQAQSEPPLQSPAGGSGSSHHGRVPGPGGHTISEIHNSSFTGKD